MRFIFKNSNRELRAGWEILLVAAAILAVTLVVSFGLSLRIDSRQLFDQGGWVRLLKANGLYMLIVVCFTVRVLHRRPLGSIGLPNPDRKDFFAGFAGGALLISCTLLLLWALGIADLQRGWLHPNWGQVDVVDLIITSFLAGIGEEILFRGYIQHLLSRRIGVFLAVGITSVLFSLAHMGNPGYTWISALNIILIALIFSVMTIRTGKLYSAMALHISWNLFQGYIFGVAVSGNIPHGLYTVQLTGAAWLTGGTFGMEGSLAVTFILGLVFVFLLLRLPLAWRGAGMRITGSGNSRPFR
ncbi:CPBP family intramembrane glutamic endopeptidase [Paenibacillus tianjinensis]|uniref:CPBP family intramembrane metalloprotease n=1 Tax=Paenibacillus tianjinensis TaxID=2810347 RepID=A0ABX7LC11_9BACL|nr:CPBP family intramembrane glutamic endopeptidase [Paenibacillus tianjinensis]QSF45680.1 CPBP family intramembrane metalloprotease [Paenibacillus tianjinensis]